MTKKPGDEISTYNPSDETAMRSVRRFEREEKRATRKRLSPRALAKAHPKLFAVLLACLVFSVGAYAAAGLIVRFPSTPAHGILLNCGIDGVPAKTSVVINSTGAQLATCPGGQGLFRILAGTNATANYTLPSPYLNLYAYPAGQDSVIVSRCTDAPAAIPLSRPWNAGFSGNWSLCADYGAVGASGLPGFAVNWTVS